MKAIFTKYLPYTETLPSRIKATDHDGNSVTISHDAATGDRWETPHDVAALALCKKMGWTHDKLARGGDCRTRGFVYVFVYPSGPGWLGSIVEEIE